MSVEPRLASERCVPCEGGVPPLDQTEAERLRRDLAARWQLASEYSALEANLKFVDFAAAMRFLNQLADLAEGEGHHPDFYLHGWNQLRVTLSTHAIGGLSRNDFILAAKLDQILASSR